MSSKDITIHFIDESSDKLIQKAFVSHVPCAHDEIRLGGEGNEQYYHVTRIVWVYDEPVERVNIGVKKIDHSF